MALTGSISKLRLLTNIEFSSGLKHVCNSTSGRWRHVHEVNNWSLRHLCRHFAAHPNNETQTLAQVCKNEKIAHRTSGSTVRNSSSSSSSSDSDIEEQGLRRLCNQSLQHPEHYTLYTNQQLGDPEEHTGQRLSPPTLAPQERTLNNWPNALHSQILRKLPPAESPGFNEGSRVDNIDKAGHRICDKATQCSTNQNTLKDVNVEYCRGLPVITVPLPSRRERCKFTLKPISNNVGDLIAMLKQEDRGIDRVVATSMDNTRIAASNTIENLLEEDFKLIVNDHCYIVHPPKKVRITNEEAQKLSDIKSLVSQLYEVLNVQEHTIQTEKSVVSQLEALREELIPLEEQKIHLDMIAQRKSEWMSWIGLGYMSVQFGILARLTWWEYSWDIMEPITYFVTYGSAMVGYAYFLVTKQEYVLQDFKDRQELLTMHKKAKKSGLDLVKYNSLKEQISMLERDLYKLQHPLKLRMTKETLNEKASSTATPMSSA